MATKRNTIKRNIKLLSWSAFIGGILITIISVYNTFVYLQNLKQVKSIIQLIDSSTSAQTKDEIIQVLTSHISSSATILILTVIVGLIFALVIFFLARKIKKETDQRIHSMDWIIE